MSMLKPVMRKIAPAKLTINPENLRFRKGQVIDGVKVTDTYNLGTLKDAIRASGGVENALVVEEMPDKSLIVLAGNRRLSAVLELLADKTTTVELIEAISELQCLVYKDLTDRQRRDLVNDQRNQKYFRSEVDIYCWKLQSAGMTYPEIAMFVWPQFATYAAGGARKTIDIEKCSTEAERKKEVTTWLKGTLDNTILRCGKLGPRVRKAMLLSDMQLDGISPVIGKNDKGEDILELPEFKPTQNRCGELFKAMNADPNWTPENGGNEFNALINKYIAADKGLDENGDPLEKGPTRASVDLLKDQINRSKSNAAKVALRFAQGHVVQEYTHYDDEAYRLEQLIATATKHRGDVKNAVVSELLQIFLSGDSLQLTTFLAGHS